MAISTKANGRTISKMVRARWTIPTEMSMRVCGWMARRMGRACITTATVHSIREISWMGRRMVLEWLLSPTKQRSKQFGTKLTSKVQARCTTATGITSKASTHFHRSRGRVYISGRMHSITVVLRKTRWRGMLRLNSHSLSTTRAK